LAQDAAVLSLQQATSIREDDMTVKTPPTTREERLAKALRDNLARRKALVRAKRARSGEAGKTPEPATDPAPRDESPS
jgi:hypothetical protein